RAREAGAHRGWPERGARGVIATGPARPARTVGGRSEVRVASLQEGPRGRRAPWMAGARCAWRHCNGAREAGAHRGWPERGGRGVIARGPARPARTVDGRSEVRVASLQRGPRGRRAPWVAGARWAWR